MQIPKNPPRPEGFDYAIPDPQEVRCQHCNRDGMNRTGMRPINTIGSSTTGFYAVKCEYGCEDGLVATRTDLGG